MAARIAGCDPIIAVDRLTSRLALARELGATHTLESRGAETLAEIRKITGGGTDFALRDIGLPAGVSACSGSMSGRNRSPGKRRVSLRACEEFVPDSPLEEGRFELAVPPRWRAQPARRFSRYLRRRHRRRTCDGS
jgi:hypothetical protein